MGSGDGSELLVVVWWVGWIALALTVALGLQVLALRARNNARERRRARVFAAWRPLLFAHVVGAGPPLPVLLPRDEEPFLLLWNQLQDGLLGDARARLAAVGEAIGARDAAHRMLRRGDVLGRLLGVHTLGHLAHPADYDGLLGFLDDRRPYLCLAAAYALARVDPGRAPHDVVPRLALRPEWPVALYARALGEADPRQLAPALLALEGRLPAAEMVRLLPLTAFLPAETASELLRNLLTASDDPEVLCGVLRVVRDPVLLDVVRAGCRHPAFSVRTQAAAALGRVGTAEDRPALFALLRDANWWVRYRAAQTLASGRYGRPAELIEEVERLQDRFARDIVQHALAEARP